MQQYDPYGQPFGEAGTWMGTFGYGGEQIDSTGLSYNRARYYNPALGAFASLDPFEGIEDEPMSMNGYSYAHNNRNYSGWFLGITSSFVNSCA